MGIRSILILANFGRFWTNSSQSQYAQQSLGFAISRGCCVSIPWPI